MLLAQAVDPRELVDDVDDDFKALALRLEVIVSHAASLEVMERVRSEVVVTVRDALGDAGIGIPVPASDVRLQDRGDA